MLPVVANILRAGIAKAVQKTPTMLTAISAKLSALTGRTVAGGVGGIMKAITEYAGKNPVKTGLVVSSLASVGVEVAADQIRSAVDADSNVQSSAIFDEIEKMLTSNRAKHTGDGDPDTVWGLGVDERRNQVIRERVIRDTIDDGARAAGSLPALMAIRKAVMLEDADFEVYNLS